MDMGTARTVFASNPGEAFRLAQRMGVSRSLVSELLSGKREATGYTSRQVVAEILKRATELDRPKRRKR